MTMISAPPGEISACKSFTHREDSGYLLPVIWDQPSRHRGHTLDTTFLHNPGRFHG